MVRLLLVALSVATAWAAPTADQRGYPTYLGRGPDPILSGNWEAYDTERLKKFGAEDILAEVEEGSGVYPTVIAGPSPGITKERPCPTTTEAPPCTTTAPPCPTTTEAPCTTTTTTAAPCTTTTTTEAPCTTTTTTAAPCTTTTTTEAPCLTTEATTTATPCSTTITTQSPCKTTTVPTIVICPGTTSTTERPVDTVNVTTERPLVEKVCRDGWTRFGESCYFVERNQKKSLKEAEAACRTLNATLFTGDNMNEYDAIIKKAPLNTHTWLGLHKAKEQVEPHWHFNTTLDHKKLNWLIEPYTDVANGWSAASQCAAHWNAAVGKYVFWYPCDYNFHYVCERNSTPQSEINDLF